MGMSPRMPGGSMKPLTSLQNSRTYCNGKTKPTADIQFTAKNSGLCFVVAVIGNTIGSSATMKLFVNDNEFPLVSDSGHTAIDGAHDNDATAYTACVKVSAGDVIKVRLTVATNINDCTFGTRFYN